MPNETTSAHHWKFTRIGGLDQVALETADDLLNLRHLDQKLWVALSCPVQGLELDEKTLALIDTDGDGRIRVPELLAAIDWLRPRLADLASVLKPSPALPLPAINAETPEGAAVLASAKQILAYLGKPGADSISVEEASDSKKIFAGTRFNGDGIITAASADTDELRQLIADIIGTQGPETDLSGQPGISLAKLDQFYADIAAHAAWAGNTDPSVHVLGAGTAAAYAALKAVRAKIDDYFTRCGLAAFDARATAALNRAEADYAAIAAQDLRDAADGGVGAFPLAHIEPGRPLPLTAGVNPAWAAAVREFHARTVTPLLGAGKTELSSAEWTALAAGFAPYEAWLAARTGGSVAGLGLDRIRKINTNDLRGELAALVARDRGLEPQALAIASVDRLARYCRDIGALLRNFVNFHDFYDPSTHGIFQAGTLYLDARSCELCVRVNDPAAHSVLAALSRVYIAYCDLRRPDGATMKIAACFTQGDSDYLIVGRNGVFYDIQGRDWDATITKIVENPISIRQAFWAPYKKLIRFIEEQVAKRAAAADTASTEKLNTTAVTVANADKAPPAAPKKIDIGTVAALGVAVGAIGGALGAIATGLARLSAWQLLLVPPAVILLISLPSMVIAWIKLRQRTLGPILDATGWAVNGRVRINFPLGTALTDRAQLPSGAKRSLDDPFADRAPARRRRWFILILLLALAALATRWDHNRRGHYFWQKPAAANTATDAAPAPAAPDTGA